MWGAVCGDILGSGYEFEEIKYPVPENIRLMREGDNFTDDSAMTFAVMEWLLMDVHTALYDDAALKQLLARRMVHLACDRFKQDSLGFGGRFWDWCCRGAVEDRYDPINSFGNGAGMRVSPVGWFFDTMEETLRFAKLSADVTHDHPEGQKGAQCIAAAVYLARKGKSKAEIRDWLSATASILMPARVEPTLTLAQTRSVAAMASGMERISFQSPVVAPFWTRAEKPPIKLTPQVLAARSRVLAIST